ncbi:hypothetical protein [Maribellus maritimus]|uniref:hypothetical protein n=1 Tax=Maribellus maritimus TaxID=2870838 RepID=UPI001EEA772B|nr:hypothetical protein [Maribellus maritimus]MCG6191264.1 hypothetical protein [Maribellus maritimus]
METYILKAYRPNIHPYLLISVGFIALWIEIAITRPEELTNIGFIIASIFFLVFVGPPVVLTVSYFLQDLNKQISIDKTKGIISVEKNAERHEFKKQD